MKIDAEILGRVAQGKRSAANLRRETHTAGYRNDPRRKLTALELKLNRHNAKAERDYCAKLLRAGRRGLNAIQAHWAAIGVLEGLKAQPQEVAA